MTVFKVAPNNTFGPITRLLDIHFPGPKATVTAYTAPKLDVSYASIANAFAIESGVPTAATTSTNGTKDACWICAAIAYDMVNAGFVSGITESTNTLTFARQGRTLNTGNCSAFYGTGNMAVELWTAWAPNGFNPTNASVTYLINGLQRGDSWGIIIFGVTDVTVAQEFDLDSALPASGFDQIAGLPPIVPFSTANPTDLMIAIDAASDADTDNTGYNFPPPGWTNLSSCATAYGMHIEVNYMFTTSKVVGGSYQNQSTSTGHWTTLITGMLGQPVPT